MKIQDNEIRNNFRLLQTENPNYFGNLDEELSGFTPVLQKNSDTSYEELAAVSYDPGASELRAVIEIKQQSGYSGDSCTEGSKEYVRFYLDYGDGEWIDEGVTNTDVHDLPFDESLCYSVALGLEPARTALCFQSPVLPKVRAILSWDQEPPADKPGWNPVWGNRLEADIQIKPRLWRLGPILEPLEELGWTDPLDTLDGLFNTFPAVQATLEEEAIALSATRPLPDLRQLKEAYGPDVDDARLAFPRMHRALGLQESVPKLKGVIEQAGIAWPELWEKHKQLRFDTTYEEVHNVGLDPYRSVLSAAIHLKRRSGYTESLCEKGSREYVAFHMDFGSGWQFMGTSSVVVHDIPEAPSEGLWYHVALPVDLTPHQKAWCKAGRAKVRAILAWDQIPAPQADFVARWGDWEECHVEIRPLPKGVTPGITVPLLESVGGMPVATIGKKNGLANGESPTGLKGTDSPFGGRIEITGMTTNAPDYSRANVSQLEYRLMVKGANATGFEPCTRKQEVWVTEIHGSVPGRQRKVELKPDPTDGWMPYLPDLTGPDITSVARKLLGVYIPSEEGLHELYVEVRDPNANPPTVTKSQTVKLEVDLSPPEVNIEITSGTGNCGMFRQGDVIEGTFSMSDRHGDTIDLSVTPSAEAGGTQPEIVGLGGASADYDALQLRNEKWKLDTTGMDSCGYNIRIRGEDRTILNSRHRGYEQWDIQGFCLLPAES